MNSLEMKRLAHLLNDMQIQNSHSSETAVDSDLVLLICDLVSLVRCQINEKFSLAVEASQSYIVHLPENTFRLILLNLLLNAAQALAGKALGHICIKIDKSKTGLTIQVLDNGAGFPQDILNHGIASLRACRQRGIGSGLAITQQFVENIGGRISLSNQSPHGACVTIFLPNECIVSE